MNEYVRLAMDSRRENEFKMPPVGITVTRIQLSGKVLVSFTVRCDKPNCWLVVTQTSEYAANKFLDDHKNGVKYPNGERGWPECPSPPMRESLPSGYKYIDKLWFELDDAMNALYDGPWPYKDLDTKDEIKSYMSGLAFSIVMLDSSLWPNKAAVAKEAQRRRKMRKDELEYEETPSRHRGDLTVLQGGAFGESDDTPKKVTAPTKPKPPAKAAPKGQHKPDISLVPEATVAAMRAAFLSSLFTADDLAKMYGVSKETVEKIVG